MGRMQATIKETQVRLKDMAVAYKLWAVVLGGMVAMLGLSSGLLWFAERTDAHTRHITEAADARIAITMRWKALTELSTERFLVSATSTEPSMVRDMALLSRKNNVQIAELQKQVEAVAVTPRERAHMEKLLRNRAEFLRIALQLHELREAGQVQEATAMAQSTLRPATQAFLALQDELVHLQEQLREEVRQQAVQQRRNAYLVAVGLTLALIITGVVLASLLVRSITQPLARAVTCADAIAMGQLNVEVREDRGDELGRLLRSLAAMAERLRDVVGEVRTGVDAVSSASSQMAQGNQDLSGRTEQTAAQLQQTAASIDQLANTVGQTAETARQANQLAGHAVEVAERGGAVVEQAVRSMEAISASSRKIGDIIGVIDGIAFQTNILALNAAVEAARAGEQGRGFAVVAGEVRQLAQRSAEAAKEIKSLIHASVGSVETGSHQVAQAGGNMAEIVASVRRVTDLMGEISASTQEQRDGIAQVNQAVSQLDQMAQQNAALVEESSAAASAMSDQAQRLAEVVAIFQVGRHDEPRNVPRLAGAQPGQSSLAWAASR